MSSTAAIGIFDSGIGGITICNEIIRLLPNENIIYLADSKHAPYGEKSEKEIIELSIKNVDFLLNKGCKLIVVACNTATTNAIETLRQTYSIPFIGIEPAIKPAALKSLTNTVGVLATKGTLSSALFSKTSEKHLEKVTILERNGEGIVPLMESGQLDSPKMRKLLNKYLQPMLDKNIDYLVLGCSHYPYLIPQLKKIVGPKVTIIDSGEAVAKQTKNILEQQHLLNKTGRPITHHFISNINTHVLKQFVDVNARKTIVEEVDF
ncbi:MAG: glutamate racemase [Flavobacteriaceae bacterium]|nr:MAG: glutamate racemase [Flavobacteriaceae bacterium]